MNDHVMKQVHNITTATIKPSTTINHYSSLGRQLGDTTAATGLKRVYFCTFCFVHVDHVQQRLFLLALSQAPLSFCRIRLGGFA